MEPSQNAKNELLKLTATFCSNLGVAVIVAGLIAPGVQLWSHPETGNLTFVLAGVYCALVGLCLHLMARSLIRMLP